MTVVEPIRSKPEVIDPSWRRWLDLVELAGAESQHSAWLDCVDVRDPRAPDSPLLHGATLRVTAPAASSLVMRLAGELGILAAERVDPLAVILAGIERDTATMDALASRLAIPTDTVAVVAQLSALPLLLNAAKKLDPEASRTWQRGYCPVCGAWPSLGEVRGIQRERRLRCGCCGGDWMLPVVHCAFCDETNHTKLGYLLNDEGEQHIKVETCTTCRGYLKTVSTLSTLPYPTLVLKDLSSVAYDLAARDRGYARPSVSGWQLEVEIVQ